MREREQLENYTLDAFLGGRITLFQPSKGYRANIDSILLAASVVAKKGQRVLELGCGVGTVLFSLMSRVQGLSAVGIESQKEYAKLAVRNAERNGFNVDIVACDISSIPSTYKNLQYDHVVLNPPYFLFNNSMPLSNYDKNMSKREINLLLNDWIEVAIKRCSVRGEIILIHQAERLGDIIKSIDGKLGDIKILPIVSFNGEYAKRIIVKGKKGSSASLKILSPLVIHQRHSSNKSDDTYTKMAEAVLRKASAIHWTL